ncbi:kinesin-4-like protein [Carex littledalei]|uniref:Kinesin-4-like protein n=1 Tax=Carex littledalei TaxID=544730 RepID=A0A833RH43_9POAL|nr:kinesin-4-like protein [Carex littledalei]
MDVDQQCVKPREIDLVTMRAQKATARRYEAATWLRKMGAAELPETPSEEEFKFFLKNGIVLCNVLNKIHPGAVSQVVEEPVGSTGPEEIAALCAYQHFENLRNFVVAVQDLGLPTFEPSDLQQEGTSLGVVNCILALKSYIEVNKQQRPLPPKSHGQSTPSVQGRQVMRKYSGLFRSSSLRDSNLEKNTISVDFSIKSTEMSGEAKPILFCSKKEGLKIKCASFEWQKKQIQDLKHCLQDLKNGVEHIGRQQFEDIARLGKNLHEVAKAASGYQKVLEENRKLYNQVMDLKGNIRVYCRVRPFLPGQSKDPSTIGLIEEGKITIVTSKNGKEGFKPFNFNKVFSASATQEEVFSDMQPLIRSVLDGYNICIFAYGQTGSGKTYTMSGPKEVTETSMGVNYRALNDLFYIIENRREIFSYEISVQMIEIYNEQVRDLLSKKIRNNPQNGLAVPYASVVTVQSTADVIELMKLGQGNRAVGATAMNDRSSRSHSCLTIHVKGKELTSGTIQRGCMHLIDLAGSERVEKSEARGERLKEAQHINKSLSALGDVIASLAQSSSHVPYRNSKLTQLLQGSLGGQAKTLMFVHISPEMNALGETLSTLNFAERVSSVELGAARANKESVEVKGLREEITSD